MFQTFRKIFLHTPALLTGFGVFLAVISLVAIFPSREALGVLWLDEEVRLPTKLLFIFSLYGSLLSNQTWASGFIAIVTAMLSGLNAALMVYYIKIVRLGRISKRISLASLGGMVAGFLGIGCAACGSLILTTLLASAGPTLLLLLPFDGVEIGVFGIVLLLYATKKLLDEIKKGGLCLVE